MNKNIIGLLPCAGTSSRIFNLPKYMLPLRDDNYSLLSNWINILIKMNCNKIIIGASLITKIFIEYIVNTQIKEISDKIVIKLVGNTETMNETVIKCLEEETYDLTIMGMPDTHITSLSPKLLEDIIFHNDIYVGAYIWNIRNTQLGKIGQCSIDNNIITNIIDKDINCNYKYGWGAIIFKPEFEKYIYKADLHTGYSMQNVLNNKDKILCKIMNGMYFDCGTTQGYIEYLNYMQPFKYVYIKGTIIIVAVYINNDIKNYNKLIKCLIQLRNIYKYETIIAVDNKSLNNKWYKKAKELEINILENNSVIHKYEMGAYKLALQHFRADNYIFIQGTIYIKQEIDMTLLNETKPDAITFDILNNLSLCKEELELINNLLRSINMKDWNNDSSVCYNSFCCNDVFIKDMLDNGLFDLPSNTKNHSYAFERILGCYFKLKLNNIKILNTEICEF